LLDGDRTLQCVQSARKFDDSVTRNGAEFPTAVLRYEALENNSANIEGFHPAGVIGCHEPAVPDNICGQQDCDLAPGFTHEHP
jgi:hypothetical protein